MGRHSNKRQKRAMNPMAGMNPMAMMMNPMAASMMMNSMAANGDQESSDSESEAPPPKALPVAAPQVAAPPLQAPAPPQPGQGNMGPVEDNELDQIVTRSASLLKNIPRRWLSEICERLDAAFDATLTANLSVTGLLACLHLLVHSNAAMCSNVGASSLACNKVNFAWGDYHHFFIF